jgi:hypothetical protein
MILAGEVIWVYDGSIRPPGDKMYVCLNPEHGIFFRINSKGHWAGSVAIYQASNPFLTHNSFVECGSVLEVDDYSIDESVRRHGVLGSVDASTRDRIIAEVTASKMLSDNDKAIILRGLN